MSMKYYVYISDDKVDMLYSQIPKKMLDKIAVELGINLGIFSLTAKGKGNQEETCYEKLMVVVNYIENNMDVGTIDQPKTYFKGSLPMRWEPLWRDGHEEGKNLIYFGAETAETIVGLGGLRVSHYWKPKRRIITKNLHVTTALYGMGFA